MAPSHSCRLSVEPLRLSPMTKMESSGTSKWVSCMWLEEGHSISSRI